MEDHVGEKAYQAIKRYTRQQDYPGSGPGIRPLKIQVVTERYTKRNNAIPDDRNN
ncbi:MAG: hypothetical protein JXA01_04545 [Dehalococcoidia bacterium]|nr:hypothetical protein [Dehalococcoidia bacterium]